MTDSPAQAEANWYPDPWGRHELRYYDGFRWTEHVASHGRQQVDPPEGAPKMVAGTTTASKVHEQVQRHHQASERAGVSSTTPVPGDGTIFGEPILVVNQKAKLIEINSEYAIYGRDGTQLGAVRQIGQNAVKKVARALTSLDQFFTHKLQVVDMSGNVLMQVTRPAKFVKSKVIVTDARGNEVGTVQQENVFGKIRFGFLVGGQRVGGIQAENWRAWNFSLRDASDVEVARITKTFEGIAKTLFTTADNYVLEIHRPIDEPLRTLVVASALTVDTALKQDSRGLS